MSIQQFTLIDKIPHSIDLEKELLASILFDGKLFDSIHEIINSHDFALPEHKKLFYAMENVFEKDSSLSTLQDYIKSNDLMDKIGEPTIVQLKEMIPDLNSIVLFAKRIKTKSKRRKLQELAVKLHGKLKEDENSTDDEIDKLLTEMFNSNTSISENVYKPIGDVYTKTLVELLNQPEPGIPTGFFEIDHILGGLCKKNLVLLAARPSMGKSMLAQNIAMNIARNKHSVAILSLEMSEKELQIRALTSLTGIPYSKIFKWQINQDEFIEIQNLLPIFLSLPIQLTEVNLNIQEIKKTTRKLKKDNNLEVLIIDYLQLIEGNSRAENKNIEIGGITKQLKALSKELDIVIILLSQLNRSLESRADKRPMDSDLRDSGSIEQDADVTMYIYRDYVYNKDADPYEAEIIIHKNRNGESHKTVLLNFDGRTMNFQNKDIKQNYYEKD